MCDDDETRWLELRSLVLARQRQREARRRVVGWAEWALGGLLALLGLGLLWQAFGGAR